MDTNSYNSRTKKVMPNWFWRWDLASILLWLGSVSAFLYSTTIMHGIHESEFESARNRLGLTFLISGICWIASLVAGLCGIASQRSSFLSWLSVLLLALFVGYVIIWIVLARFGVF